MTENLPPDQPEPARGDPEAETVRMSSGDPLAGGSTPPAGDQPPRPEPPPAARRFQRSRDDRLIAGVAGGLAATLGIDAALVRVGIVVLSLFGGAGVLLYLAAVLLMPEAPIGTHAPRPAGTHGDRDRTLTIIGVVVLVLVAGPLLLIPAMFAGGILVPLALLALVGLLVAWLVTGRRPERDTGSVLRAIALGLGVLVLVAVLSVAAFWVAGLGGDEVVAGLVVAAGLALLAGAAVRPVRWLILPAVAVALSAGFVGAAGIDLEGGVGEKTYRPGAAADVAQTYELGAGELTVDLRGADLPAGDRRLRMEVGMGAATLIVPEDVCVATEARVGMGAVEFFDRDSGGLDIDLEEGSSAPAGTTRLVLDADVGLGLVEVRHTEPWGDRWAEDRRGAWDDGWDDDGPVDLGDRPGNEACTGASN